MKYMKIGVWNFFSFKKRKHYTEELFNHVWVVKEKCISDENNETELEGIWTTNLYYVIFILLDFDCKSFGQRFIITLITLIKLGLWIEWMNEWMGVYFIIVNYKTSC